MFPYWQNVRKYEKCTVNICISRDLVKSQVVHHIFQNYKCQSTPDCIAFVLVSFSNFDRPTVMLYFMSLDLRSVAWVVSLGKCKYYFPVFYRATVTITITIYDLIQMRFPQIWNSLFPFLDFIDDIERNKR